jgi:hypothetical protein
MKVSDMSSQAPVGTTLAILERTLKVMTAVQARLHYAMKMEFKLLKVIIADYTPESYDYEPEDGDRSVKKADYDLVDVIPVSDPNAATMAQKIVQYQAVLQLAQSAPNLYNLPLLHRQMIEVLGIKNAAKLVPMDEDAVPTDPVSENQAVLNNKPVKAFIEQNHEAHIQVHMAAIQSPKVQQLLQMNPAAQQIMAAAMAHINEHIALEMRKQIEMAMGMPLPTEEQNKQVPPELADKIAMMAAQASQQILQRDKQQAAQQQAQQQAQDPVVQMQQQELQIKQQELKLKEQKQQIDAVAKADQLEIEKERIAAQKEIAAMQVGATAAAARDRIKQQMEAEGVRMGLDAAKHRAQLAQQERQQARQQTSQSNKPPKKESK